MGPLAVVVAQEGVELRLELGERGGRALPGEVAPQGLVGALDLAARLGVVGDRVLGDDPQTLELGLEPDPAAPRTVGWPHFLARLASPPSARIPDRPRSRRRLASAVAGSPARPVGPGAAMLWLSAGHLPPLVDRSATPKPDRAFGSEPHDRCPSRRGPRPLSERAPGSAEWQRTAH